MLGKLSLLRQPLAAGFIAALVLGSVLRLCYLRRGYTHPDEVIPLQVAAYMNQSGDWDTNWRKADVPQIFKYDQYNFSSYIYAVFFFTKLAGSSSLRAFRLFSALCSILALGVLSLMGLRIRQAHVVCCAALLAAVAPILVQDAHYARPEAFVTLLTILIVFLSWPSENGRVLWPSLAAAVLVGVLVACKLSMLFFAVFPALPLLDAWHRRRLLRARSLAAALAAVAALEALGFAAGVPGALKNPAAWLHGIAFLFRQYSGIHAGASHAQGGPAGDMFLAYLGATHGWVTLLLFAVGCFSQLRQRSWRTAILVCLPPLAFFAYFAGKSVFFERNLSHVIPLYLLGAALGLQTLLLAVQRRLAHRFAPALAGALLMLAAAGPSAYWSYRLVFKVFSGKDLAARFAYRNQVMAKHAPLPIIDASLVALDTNLIDQAIRAGKAPFLVYLWDITDKISDNGLERFLQLYDAVEAGRFPSLFLRVPPCTLHAYASWTDRYYLVRGHRTAPTPPRPAN